MRFQINKDVVSGIYSIRNLLNNRIYVGSAENLYRRYKSHISVLNRARTTNKFLLHDWNKCGADKFVFELLESCDIVNLLAIEQKYLDIWYDNQNICYNICKKAGNTRGRKHSKKSKKKMSLSKMGNRNPSKRKAVRRKLSLLMTGKNNHQFGKKRPWAAEIGKKFSSKPVMQIDKLNNNVIKIWSSASEASKILGFDRSSINKCCRMNTNLKTYKGFVWKFVEADA